MGAPTPGLVRWLTRLLADLTEEGMITRFELIHKVEAEHADRLDIWRNDADFLFAAPMPSGVEHPSSFERGPPRGQLFAAPMPSGVEHLH